MAMRQKSGSKQVEGKQAGASAGRSGTVYEKAVQLKTRSSALRPRALD